MTTVNDFLADFFHKAAKRNGTYEKAFQDMEADHRKRGNSDSAEICKKNAAFHKEEREHHEQCAAGAMTSKAAEGDDLSKVAPMPAGLSVLTPDNPWSGSVRAVPRNGAPTPGSQEQKVAPEFAKMVALEED